jgi:hypothetical protein
VAVPDCAKEAGARAPGACPRLTQT